jgi:predicted TIM-barrel fold metal-dependent hydrolase
VIIDVHTHVGPISAFNGLDTSVASMLGLMDFLGIDLCMQIPTAGLMGCFEEAFEVGESAYELSEGRLLYSLSYDPHYIGESVKWFADALSQPGFVGIKIHPSLHRIWPDDPRYEPAWRFAAEHDLPMLTHSWAVSGYNPVQKYSTPDQFASILTRYPTVPLVLGHAGGRYQGHLAAVELVKKHPNAYVDTSGDCYAFGFIEWLVKQVGAQRILFGSDLNWIDPRSHLGRIYDADITPEEKELILGENARRLYRLTQ